MAVASNGWKEDGGPLEPYTLDLLGLVPDRSLPLSLSLSSRAIGEREREGEGGKETVGSTSDMHTQ